ncbi:MAG: hypothetical protein A2046_00125 [Bacteroidetes bacterium GWA2_30_7]|nr:MAG: hypothetical protein A2046_00125 [Bacteroidetes bacterium GWA2_30_7]
MLLLALLLNLTSAAQPLRQYIQNFTQKDYGDSCHAQNWSVVQDERGIMYFGNNNRVLEYDGETWNSIRITANSSFITSLAINNNQIYVGANGEFGFLSHDIKGKLIYNSLSVNLEEEYKFFGNIWKTFPYKDGAVFFSQEALFIYKNNKLEVIAPSAFDPDSSFHLAFQVNNEIYVRQRGLGLLKLKDNALELIPNSEIFKDLGIFGMVDGNNKNEIFIVTQEDGFYIYNTATSQIDKLESASENELKLAKVFGAIKLNDGNIALNTALAGVIIVNFKGDIIYKINSSTGLKDNDIKQVFESLDNNLWLSSNSCISKINYSSKISIFNSNSGIIGRINSIELYNDLLFVGTSSGLFIENKSDNNSGKYFKPINELSKNISSIKKFKNELIISSPDGLYSYNGNNIKQIDKQNSQSICLNEKLNQLYVAGTDGFSVFQKNNDWMLKTKVKDLSLNSTTIAINQKNLAETELWIGTFNDGIYRILVKPDFSVIYDKFFGNQVGLDNGWVMPFTNNGNVIFATLSGLLNYNDDDSLKTNRGFFEGSNLFNLNNSTITILDEYQNNYLCCIDGKVCLIDKSNNLKNFADFESVNLGNINALYKISDNKIAIGGDEGLNIIRLDWKTDTNISPIVNIRKIVTNNDSIIFDDFSAIKNNEVLLKLSFENNSIRINFSTIYKDNDLTTRYFYKLNAYDDDWLELKNQSFVDYKKLSEGNYEFNLKCTDTHRNESNVKTLKFQILPPWYRTIYAYIIYLVLLIFLIIISARLYSRQLKLKNIRLEKIVQERTAEIQLQNIEISHQRDELSEQKREITDSIQYAKRIQQAMLPSLSPKLQDSSSKLQDLERENVRQGESENLHTVTLSHGHTFDLFVLFRPKDIVSGDFYWTTLISTMGHDPLLVVAVADCTGHGVPGAFMSMLGISFLNEIVRKKEITQASRILDQLRISIIDALRQTGESGTQKDGMDMSLVVIKNQDSNSKFQDSGSELSKSSKLLESYKAQWAGANNPLWLVRSSKEMPPFEKVASLGKGPSAKNLTGFQNLSGLEEIKPDKMPVAIYEKMNDFTNNDIQLFKGDYLYMMTDGYEDQFGGPKGKKFLSKNLKQLLIDNCQLPMEEQKNVLEKTLNEWIGSGEQIDDITVLGIKI